MAKTFQYGESSVGDHGYDVERLSKLAALGFVFDGIHREEADGRVTEAAHFSFTKDCPMGRMNVAAGDDIAVLDTAVEDAQDLTYEQFIEKYPSLGPYADWAGQQG